MNKSLIISKKLNLKIFFDKKVAFIDHIEDFKKSFGFNIDIDYANIKFDFKKNIIKVFIKTPILPVLRNKKPLKHFNIYYDIKNKKLKVDDFATFKLLSTIKGTIKNIELNLTSTKNKTQIKPNLNLTLLNTTIYYKNLSFFIKRGHFLKKGNKILFKGVDKNNKIIFLDKNGSKKIEAKLTATYVNKIFNKDIFKGGQIKLKVKEHKGEVLLKNTFIKEFKLLNNLFAAINTIPSIITLNNPGYSKEGLFIKRGKIRFLLKRGFIIIKDIDLDSNSLNISGNGVIDLENEKIFLKLKLQTLKSVSKIIKNIPIAGYIILGDDGKIYTTVEIRGDLKNPTIKSLLPQESIKMPFNIIKRTLNLPFKLFE